MLFLILLNFIFSINVKVATAADAFYRIKIPVSSLSCEEEAVLIGQRYAQLAKKSAIKVNCSGTSKIINEKKEYPLYVLDMIYPDPTVSDREQIQTFYYGVSSFENEMSNREGLYATMGDCLKELSARTKEFQEHSKYPILASTCEKATSIIFPTYVTRIDTVGKPKISLFSTRDMAFQFKEPFFKTSVEKIIEMNNGHIVARSSEFILYFAEIAVEPQSHRFGTMNEAACTDQIPEMKKILDVFGKKDAVFGCNHFFVEGKGIAILQSVWNHFLMIYDSYDPYTYSDYNECNRDKSRVIDQHKSQGHRVISAICRFENELAGNLNEPYQMSVYLYPFGG